MNFENHRDELEYLREENRQLKELLICEKNEFYEIGLPRVQRKMLSVLMDKSPHPVSVQRIYDKIWFDKSHVDLRIVDVVLCQLRRNLKKHGIKIFSIWNVGRYIDTQNRDKLLNVVQEICANGGKIDHEYKRRVA